jgi:transposase
LDCRSVATWITTINRSIARFEREIAERLGRFDALIERIDAVTGLSRRSIEVLLGELGWDMSHFPDAAHAAGHTQTYLGEQYRRISARRGAKKAAMAVGHSILVIFYHMVKTGEPYHEKGADYFTPLNKEKLQHRLVRQLERLGNTVILQPQAETALA